MNIRDQLLLEHSKHNSELIRDYIEEDQKKFRVLFNLFTGNEYRVSQRAAMVISACFDKSPKLVEPFKVELIDYLLTKSPNVAVKRNTLRILQFIEIPSSYQARLFDYALEALYSLKEPIAIKAFSMQVAYCICVDFPDLKMELEEVIHLNMKHSQKAGIHARGKNILKKLQKL